MQDLLILLLLAVLLMLQGVTLIVLNGQGVFMADAMEELRGLIANIGADIDELVSKLPTEGGLTADQVAELRTSLAATADKYKSASEPTT